MADPSSERWIAQILDAAGCGIVIVDRTGAVVLINARARALATALGVASAEQLLDPRVPRDGIVTERQRLSGTDGYEAILLSQVDAGAAADAAQLRVARLEQALRDLSVVSHKINNPITALLGRAQLLRARTHTDAQVEKSVVVIDESAAKVAELAKELSKLLKEARRESAENLVAPDRLEPVGSASTH